MRKYLLLVIAGTMASAASSAQAGFTVTVDPTNPPVVTDFGPDGVISVGDTFASSAPGGFSAYVADSPSDPQLTGGDLANYMITLQGIVSSIVAPNLISYTGTYFLFYDNAGPDLRVSSGTFEMTATFIAPGQATVTGELIQTLGPEIPAFADLSYGGNPITFTGTYTEVPGSGVGSLNGVLRQDATVAAVPEPSTLLSGSVAALAGLAFGLRRRARARAAA